MSSEEKEYIFDGAVQDDILRLILRDSAFSAAAQRLVVPSYFQGKARRWVCDASMAFEKAYSMPPTKGSLATEIDIQVSRKEVDDEVGGMVKELLDRLFVDESSTPRDYTVKLVQDFARHRAYDKASYEILRLIDKGRYDDVDTMMEGVRNLGVPIDDGVYWYFETALERIRRRGTEDAVDVFPTGIIEVDSLMRRGGVGRGEVFVWLGPKGGGKSLAMGQMARRTVHGGHKVLIFSFEMSAEQVSDRQDAGFSGVSSWELEKRREDVYREMSRLAKQFPRSLAIKKFATKQFTMEACVSCLESLRRQQGWKPDMVVLDYLSIVRAKVRRERHEEIQEIAEDFRGMCDLYEVAGHTANQINREGAEKLISTGGDAAGSWDQLASPDYVFTINRPDMRNVIYLFADKVRDGKDKFIVGPLETDWERMIFAKRTNITEEELRAARKRWIEDSEKKRKEGEPTEVGKGKGRRKRVVLPT